jgi:hypothetical protein
MTKKLSVFTLPLGRHIDPDAVVGYYIDLSEKAPAAEWPPEWFPFPGFHRYIAIGQWGLGAYERYLTAPTDAWRAAMTGAAQELIATQRSDGLWVEPEPYPHTFRMDGPWPSAMAQGLCASFLVRVARELQLDAAADAARLALAPLLVETEDGGAMARLEGVPFPEEYPTVPPSFVLNGALYAMFGVHDVARGLGDARAGSLFDDLVGGLVQNLHRWDLGYWSRYDLYPHPIVHVASRSYHALHVNQLRVLDMLAPHATFADTAKRWDVYAGDRRNSTRAFLVKGSFRMLVPRNHTLAGRLPWADVVHRSRVRANAG